MDRFSLIELSSSVVGKPYILGSFDKEKGLDCLSLMINYVESLGVKVPENFMGVTKENYKSLWEKDKAKAKVFYLKWIRSFTKEVSESYMKPGDILIVKSRKDSSIGFGIYGGNRKIFSVFIGNGIDILTLDLFEIQKVYRII